MSEFREELERTRETLLQDPVARELDQLDLGECWMIGGSIRDAYYGLKLRRDFDLLSTEVDRTRAVLREFTEHEAVMVNPEFPTMIFPLAEARIDLAGVTADSVEEDLKRRDCTINGVAIPWGGSAEDREMKFPPGTPEDFAERCIRTFSPDIAFAKDPIRVIRVFRMAAHIGGEVDSQTLGHVGRHAEDLDASPAERKLDELMKLLQCERPAKYVKQMRRKGVLLELIPILRDSEGCDQNDYHHLDVLGHSLECLTQLEEALDRLDVYLQDSGVRELVEDSLDRCVAGFCADAALRLTLLVHDAGKPETKEKRDGRYTFYRHEQAGSEMAREWLREEMHAPNELIDAVTTLTEHHLRPGYLSNLDEVTEKAVYRLCRDTEPWTELLLLHALADDLATRGELREESDIDELCRVLERLGRFLIRQRESEEEDKLLDGNDVMELLDMEPGPEVGDYLEKIREARSTGEIETREEAEKLLRELAGAEQ